MKKPHPDEPAASNRLYSLIQMGGTSKEKREISLSMSPRQVIIVTHTWDVEKKDRHHNDVIEVSNIKALQRLHALLGVAIKTFEQ